MKSKALHSVVDSNSARNERLGRANFGASHNVPLRASSDLPRATGCSLYSALRGYISLHLSMQDARGSVQASRQSSASHLVLQTVATLLQSSMQWCRSWWVSESRLVSAVLSTAQTNCAGTRRDSVPVGLREKGREALVCFSSAHIAARVAKRGAMCAAPFQLPVSAPPSSDVFGFAFWL